MSAICGMTHSSCHIEIIGKMICPFSVKYSVNDWVPSRLTIRYAFFGRFLISKVFPTSILLSRRVEPPSNLQLEIGHTFEKVRVVLEGAAEAKKASLMPSLKFLHSRRFSTHGTQVLHLV